MKKAACFRQPFSLSINDRLLRDREPTLVLDDLSTDAVLGNYL